MADPIEAAAEALRLTPAGTYKRQARAAVVAYLRARATEVTAYANQMLREGYPRVAADEQSYSDRLRAEADRLEKENARG